jgi:hypothetical protein
METLSLNAVLLENARKELVYTFNFSCLLSLILQNYPKSKEFLNTVINIS